MINIIDIFHNKLYKLGERLNRFSSMIIDKIRRAVKAKHQETTEVRDININIKQICRVLRLSSL